MKYDKEYVCFCMPLSGSKYAGSLRKPMVFSMIFMVSDASPDSICPGSHLEQRFKAENVAFRVKSTQMREVGVRNH